MNVATEVEAETRIVVVASEGTCKRRRRGDARGGRRQGKEYECSTG